MLGWHDPDRKKPPRQKLAEGVEAYRRKHGREPTVCLASGLDAIELRIPTRRHPDPLPVAVQAGPVARWTFLLGEEVERADRRASEAA